MAAGPRTPSDSSCCTDITDPLYKELWHACAGPCVTMPRIGERVFYFPQGHIEQIEASITKYLDINNQEAEQQVPLYDLPSKILCRVTNVLLQVEQDTDELFAHITLVPETEQDDCSTDMDPPRPPPPPPPRPSVHSFCKTLTLSETSPRGILSVPRRQADKCLAPLDKNQQPQELVAKDLHGNDWRFRHIYRDEKRIHLLTVGWKVFVNSKRLVAGDAFIFLRDENGELRVRVRRAMCQQSNIPSSVISSGRMQIAVLAAASHAISRRTKFSVYYKPRNSPSEFIIPYDQYMEAMNSNFLVGMRFRMRIEGEAALERRFTGTIIEIGDSDPLRWPGSKWRYLKVQWDAISAIPQPERVSPWKIEPVLTPSEINPLPKAKNKRSRPNVLPPKQDLSVLEDSGAHGGVDINLMRNMQANKHGTTEHQPGFPSREASKDKRVDVVSGPANNNRKLSSRHLIDFFPSSETNPSKNRDSVNEEDLQVSTHAPKEFLSQFSEVDQQLVPRRLIKSPTSAMSCEQQTSSWIPLQEIQCRAHRRSCTKVHKQGSALGRALDLTKFVGYKELFHELEVMFNFEGQLEDPSKGWQLVYTDDEGDMMLVGDNPWQEFCSIVLKIFIYKREEVEKMTPGAPNLEFSRESEEQPITSEISTLAATDARQS
ncbi:hypothetical protein SUGI_0553070 [Cryptomeria japonica]|nr:hypothetical protein SUGI_0553070 [Cryptomeria japonica]